MMFTTNKKRGLILLSVIISALLCLVGAFMLAPQKKAAIAEDGAVDYAATVTFGSDVTEYSTFDDAWAYANGLATTETTTATVKMFADVATSSRRTVESGKNITLDLNGHIYKCDGFALNYIPGVSVKGIFTLIDSNSLTVHNYKIDDSGFFTFGDGDEYTHTLRGGVLTANRDTTGGVNVDGGTFTMSGGSISGNRGRPEGGGVYVASGTFIMTDGTISNNHGGGGGVYVDENGTFTMSDTAVISNNTAGYGGGVHVGGGEFIMTGGTISNNSASLQGGGVYMSDGRFEMSDGTINANMISSGALNVYGCGVYVEGGEFIMTGGTINANILTGNPTNAFGGGVCVNGTFTMSGTAVISNNATKDGGGVYVDENGTFTMSDTAVISDNTAAYSGGVGVYGEFKMENGTIKDNDADTGGGVYVGGGEFTMTDGSIVGNTASNYGGGVYVGGGEFTMSGSAVISENQSTGSYGGGVCVLFSSFIMTGGEIINNTSHYGGGGVSIPFGGMFEMSGAPKIIGNTVSESDNNVFWGNDVVITITDALEDAGKKAKIGVSSIGVVVTSGYGENNKANGNIISPSTYFVSDTKGYVPRLEGNEVKLIAGVATVTDDTGEALYGSIEDAWTDANTAGTATVTMYADAQISATLNVSSNITLDLNGHTLQMTGNDAVVYIMGSGIFTLADSAGGGVLTGGKNNVGGGVCGDEGSTFIMTGGEISGNEADSGGGVYIYSGTFKVSGDVNITGNTSDGAANNVCLENTIITVTDELTVGAQIGISYTGIVATGFTQNGKPSDYFIPDDPDYCIYLSDSAGTVAAGEHDWVLVNDEYNHWPECSVCGATDENSTEPHSGTDDNDCTTPINCSDCGRELTEGQQSHDWSTVWESDNYGHWHECQRTDCTQTSTKVEHSLVNYTCECGYTAYFEVTVNNVKSYYKTIEAAFASVTDDATVKMLADAVTTDTLAVGTYASQNVTLDLNGCMLKYNNADEHNPVITVSCNFTLIDSNTDTTKKHSIPDPDNSGGTIEVIGGLVTGGTGIIDYKNTTSGGGVYVTNGGTFTMTGGTISGNTADYGGGVYCKDAHFNISGAPVIIGNKSKLDDNRKGNNVDAMIHVTGDLTEGAKIGVATHGTVAVGYTQADDPSKYFIPDNVEHVCICAIREIESGLGYVVVHIDEHVWEWQYDIDNHKQVCYYCGETQNEGPHYLVNDECECGYSTVDCAVTVTFDGSVTEWDSIEEAFAHANSLPTTADKSAVIIMYYYAVTTDTLTVEQGKFITLDLNGRVLEYDNDSVKNSVITVNGTFTLKDSKTTKKNEITDNDGKTIEVTGGVITGGSSNTGGGVFVGGTFNMNGGTISGNTAAEDGGGVHVYAGGAFTMTGGTISDNTAAEDGGGVCVEGNSFIMSNGEISGNTATTGGGVCVGVTSAFTMTGGEISENKAFDEEWAARGGGVFITDRGTFTMTGGTISGNTAKTGGGGLFSWHGNVSVSGTPNITGNKLTDDTISNVDGISTSITVTGALTDGTQIGVYNTGEIATGFTQGDPSEFFIPDNPAYNCVYVSDKDTGTVTIGEHDYSEDFTVDVQPTCTEKGSKSKHCANCDSTTDVTPIDALGHSFGEFVIDKQPTCTAEGSKSKHCTRCDEKSEVTAIPTVPHTLNHNPAAPATEDKDGNIEYWDCEQCEKIFADEDGKTEITDRASIVIPKLKADDSSALWITVIILAIIVLALGGYIAFDVLRGKKKANGENAPAAEPSAAEKPEPQVDEQPAVEDEPAAAEDKAEEPAPEQIPEPPVAAEPQAVAAEDVPQIEPAPKAEKKTTEKKPTKSAAEKKSTKPAAEKKSTKPTVEKKAEPKAAKPKSAPKAQSRAKEEKNKIAKNISGVPETAAVIQKGDNAVATKPAVEKTLPPDEVRAEVTATEVDKIMTDEVAESFVEQSETTSDKTKQGIINIDVLSQYFDGGEVVTLDEIKKRVNGFNKKTTYIKVLARGTLDKALTVEADSFSLQAVKMIVLTGGKVIKKKS